MRIAVAKIGVKSTVGLALAVLALAASARAETKWEPYDRFGSGDLDPRAWTVSRSGGERADAEERVEVIGATLRLDSRSRVPDFQNSLSVDVASGGSSTGSPSGSSVVPVSALRATLTFLKGTRVRGCAAAGHPPSLAHAGLVGRFFHDRSADLDVGALVYLLLSSEGHVSLRGVVRHCADPQCTTGPEIWSTVFPAPTRQTTTLSIEWLAATDEIVFTRDGDPPISVSVTGRSPGPPALDKKGIQIWHQPAACPSGETPGSSVELLVDDVDVNGGAVPAR